jgi:hypothetical protein
MEPIASIEAIARVIQLAIAPVFLLAGIVGFITALSTRFGRIIDRARVISNGTVQAHSEAQRELLEREAAALWLRVRLTNWAIGLCAGSALLICLVVVALFVGELTSLDVSYFAAILFIAAMLLIVAALVCFLYETGIAARLLRRGMEAAEQDRGGK